VKVRFILLYLLLCCNAVLPAQTALEQIIRNPDADFNQIRRAFYEYIQDKKTDTIKGYKAFKRWEYFMLPRMDSTGHYTSAKTYEKFKQYQATHPQTTNSFGGTSGGGLGDWTSIGPFDSPGTGNYGTSSSNGVGRIEAIGFHPTDANVFWVGSPTGGLWKTTNGGAAWTSLSDTWSGLGVAEIAIDPNNTNTLYVASGTRDQAIYARTAYGILKTTDGGISWQNYTFNAGGGYYFTGLKIKPDNSNILFATTSRGMFRSSDAGVNWARIASISANERMSDVVFKPNDPNTVYASGRATVYRSTDGGLNFSSIQNFSGTLDIELSVTPADPNRLYLGVLDDITNTTTDQIKGIWLSTDAGTSFSQIPNSSYSTAQLPLTTQWDYDWAFEVSPTDVNEMYIGGVSLFVTKNGATTWSRPSGIHSDHHIIAYNPVSKLPYFGCDGGIYRASATGQMQRLNSGLNITQFYRIGGSATDPNLILAGAQDNGTMRKLSATTWGYDYGGDGMECWIDPLDNSTRYFSTQNGNFLRLKGGVLSGIISKPGSWVTPFAVHPTTPNMLYVGYRDVWKSNNYGDTWANISLDKIRPYLSGTDTSATMTFLRVAPSDANTIYTGFSTKLFRTTDGGTTWSDMNHFLTGTITPIRFNDLLVHPTNPNTIWACASGRVYKSIDGGNFFTNITGTLPSISMNCLTYQNNSNDGIYVGSDAGIYFRDNSMTDWALFSNGLPNVIVTEMEINYAALKIRAATHGRGVWESSLYSGALKPRCAAAISPIVGEAQACGDGVYLYTVPLNTGSTYLWSVVNGDVKKQNANQVWVKWWANAVNGSITVQESQPFVDTPKDK
jgi:photosystem II stability/assembly factor-like uncharacterized protein